MTDGDNLIEDIILSHGARGMDRVRGALPANYCSRAARLITTSPGRVLIGTGFPVGGSFETDGPIGAIALYRVLERLGYEPIFGCAPPISKVLGDGFRTLEIPILSWQASVAVVDRWVRVPLSATVTLFASIGISCSGATTVLAPRITR